MMVGSMVVRSIGIAGDESSIGCLEVERPREFSTWVNIGAKLEEGEVYSVVLSGVVKDEAEAVPLPLPLGGISLEVGMVLTLINGRILVCVTLLQRKISATTQKFCNYKVDV